MRTLRSYTFTPIFRYIRLRCVTINALYLAVVVPAFYLTYRWLYRYGYTPRFAAAVGSFGLPFLHFGSFVPGCRFAVHALATVVTTVFPFVCRLLPFVHCFPLLQLPRCYTRVYRARCCLRGYHIPRLPVTLRYTTTRGCPVHLCRAARSCYHSPPGLRSGSFCTLRLHVACLYIHTVGFATGYGYTCAVAFWLVATRLRTFTVYVPHVARFVGVTHTFPVVDSPVRSVGLLRPLPVTRCHSSLRSLHYGLCYTYGAVDWFGFDLRTRWITLRCRSVRLFLVTTRSPLNLTVILPRLRFPVATVAFPRVYYPFCCIRV